MKADLPLHLTNTRDHPPTVSWPVHCSQMFFYGLNSRNGRTQMFIITWQPYVSVLLQFRVLYIEPGWFLRVGRSSSTQWRVLRWTTLLTRNCFDQTTLKVWLLMRMSNSHLFHQDLARTIHHVRHGYHVRLVAASIQIPPLASCTLCNLSKALTKITWRWSRYTPSLFLETCHFLLYPSAPACTHGRIKAIWLCLMALCGCFCCEGRKSDPTPCLVLTCTFRGLSLQSYMTGTVWTCCAFWSRLPIISRLRYITMSVPECNTVFIMVILQVWCGHSTPVHTNELWKIMPAVTHLVPGVGTISTNRVLWPCAPNTTRLLCRHHQTCMAR